MSVTPEAVLCDEQKPEDVSKDSEELSQHSHYDTPGKGSDVDAEDVPNEEGQHSEYEEGDAENMPDVQPLDSSDEERAPEDLDEQDDLEDHPEENGDSGDSVIVEDEREEGDGQESVPAKEKALDDDEDRRNPQYIPKRGTFYEHDDRTADDGQEAVTKDPKSDTTKEGAKEGRKVWREKEERWQHDRFQEMEQAPKSKEELVMVYGYDIRNEEAPPKARRRRRYGRGPNKYTRSWEDEEAYSRPLAAFIVEKEGDSRRGRKPRIPKRGGGQGVGGGPGGGSGGGSAGPPPAMGSGRRDPKRRPRGTQLDGDQEEFPALTSSGERMENGEDRRPSSQVSFSSKVSGNSSANVAGTFNMDPREVVAPFGSQRRDNQPQRPSHHQQQKSEDDSRRTWRREESDGPLVEDREHRGSGRGRGRGAQTHPRNRRENERDGRWSEQHQMNGQNRGRGYRRGGRDNHEEGAESDGGHRNYTDEVSKEMSNMSLSKAQPRNNVQQHSAQNQHTPQPHSSQQPGSPGGEYPRRHSNGGPVSSNGVNDRERRQNMPPRMQENSSSRPKRYSSLRSRNMPETAAAPVPTSAPTPASGPTPTSAPAPAPGPGPAPTPVSAAYTSQPAHTFYQPGYGPGPVQPIYADATAAPPGHPPAVQPGAGSPLLSGAMPTTLPNALPNALPSALPCFPQAPFMAPPPGPPARLLPPGSFLPPGPAPPPQTMNFVAAPTPQPQYQPIAFQPYQPIAMVGGVSQPQPQELYQPQGGITYYSTQNQNVPRAAPLPRVKAAIPIVPPPERTSSTATTTDSDHAESSDNATQEDSFRSPSPALDNTYTATESTSSS